MPLIPAFGRQISDFWQVDLWVLDQVGLHGKFQVSHTIQSKINGDDDDSNSPNRTDNSDEKGQA